MSLTTKEVRIANPCQVDWSNMTRREANKRFCGECKKHVHDLSMMDETEARALLASPTTEGLCIRYLADERGEIAFRPDVPLSRFQRTLLVAAAAVAAPFTLTACMGSAPMPEPQPPQTTQTPSTAPSASQAPSATPPPVTTAR